MESTGTAQAVGPSFFESMGDCFSATKESLCGCATATVTRLEDGSAVAYEYISAGWSNHVYPTMQAIYNLAIQLFDQISVLFQNAMDWVESNPETAQFGLFACIIGSAFGCLAHYFVSSRAASAQKAAV